MENEASGAFVLPEFLRTLPQIDIGIPGVRAFPLRGARLCVIFQFEQDVHVPRHVHGAQFGCVVCGELSVDRAGGPTRLRQGDHYLINAQEPHEAWISKGTVLIEFFEDADRY